MALQALLIDIGKETLSAGVFTPRSEGPSGFVSVKLESPERLSSALAELMAGLEESGPVKGPPGGVDEVYVSIHPAYMHMRVLDTPFSYRKKINDILGFELMGAFSVDVSDLIFDNLLLYSGDGKTRALAVAVEKGFLRGLLATLNDFGLDPVWVGPALFTAPQIVRDAAPQGVRAALVTGDFISVSTDGAPLFLNVLNGPGGAGMSLSYLRAEGIDVDEVFYVDRDPAEIRALFPGVGSVSELTLPGGCPGNGLAVYALWFAVARGLINDAVNFRRGEFSCTRQADLTKKKFKVTAVLMAFLIAFFAGGYYLRISALKAGLASYSGALTRSYHELFPGDKPPADALYAMKIKINELNKEAEVVKGGVSPLEVMRAVAVAAKDPVMGIKINEFNNEDGKATMRGDARSFDAANRLKEMLVSSGVFKKVTLSDVKSGPSGGAVFTLMTDAE